MKTIADKLGFPNDKLISNLELYGNTSAASLPLVLDEAIQDNKIKTNDIVVLAGFGAGLTWGAVVVRARCNTKIIIKFIQLENSNNSYSFKINKTIIF